MAGVRPAHDGGLGAGGPYPVLALWTVRVAAHHVHSVGSRGHPSDTRQWQPLASPRPQAARRSSQRLNGCQCHRTRHTPGPQRYINAPGYTLFLPYMSSLGVPKVNTLSVVGGRLASRPLHPGQPVMRRA